MRFNKYNSIQSKFINITTLWSTVNASTRRRATRRPLDTRPYSMGNEIDGTWTLAPNSIFRFRWDQLSNWHPRQYSPYCIHRQVDRSAPGALHWGFSEELTGPLYYLITSLVHCTKITHSMHSTLHFLYHAPPTSHQSRWQSTIMYSDFLWLRTMRIRG